MCSRCRNGFELVAEINSQLKSGERTREFYREQGRCEEQERIIKLLETRLLTKPQPTDTLGSFSHAMHNQMINNMIALIKGENK